MAPERVLQNLVVLLLAARSQDLGASTASSEDPGWVERCLQPVVNLG